MRRGYWILRVTRNGQAIWEGPFENLHRARSHLHMSFHAYGYVIHGQEIYSVQPAGRHERTETRP